MISNIDIISYIFQTKQLLFEKSPFGNWIIFHHFFSRGCFGSWFFGVKSSRNQKNLHLWKILMKRFQPTRTLKACLPCVHHIRLLQTLFFVEVLKQKLELTREKKDPPICWFLGALICGVMYGRNMIHWGVWITLKKQHLNIFKGEQEAYPPSHWNEKPVAFTCIKIFVPSTSLCAFTASCFNLDLKPPREKPWIEGILGDSFPNHLREFPTGGLVDMTSPGLILWRQLPECNVKIKGSTNEPRKKPIMKRWDSSKTSQTHVWSPTFSPRNGPKSLKSLVFYHFLYLWTCFSNLLEASKRWNPSITLPFEAPFKLPNDSTSAGRGP